MCICVWEKNASEHAGVCIWVHAWRGRSRMLTVFFCHPPCCLETESLITAWTGLVRHGSIGIYLSLPLTAKDTGTTCSCVWSLTWMMAIWTHVLVPTGQWSCRLSHPPCPWICIVVWSDREARRLCLYAPALSWATPVESYLGPRICFFLEWDREGMVTILNIIQPNSTKGIHRNYLPHVK